MTHDEIQKLRDLPIEGVAERLGLEITRHKVLCPFHPDKHPSLTFNKRRNTYRCWSCGAHGNVIDLTMKLLPNGGRSGGGSFSDACRWLADEHNIIIENTQKKFNNSLILDQKKEFKAEFYERFFERPWLSPEAKRFLFEERHLDPRVVRWCRISSWRDKQGTNWLQIPYFSDHRLVGVQNRNLDYRKEQATPDGPPRFKFVAGVEPSIFNLPIIDLLKPDDEIWIAEGCSDCLSLLSDHKRSIAIASATLLHPRDKLLLSELSNRLSIRWKMAPDADAPGARLFEQLKEILPNLEHVALPPGCKDYSDYYLKIKRETL